MIYFEAEVYNVRLLDPLPAVRPKDAPANLLNRVPKRRTAALAPTYFACPARSLAAAFWTVA